MPKELLVFNLWQICDMQYCPTLFWGCTLVPPNPAQLSTGQNIIFALVAACAWWHCSSPESHFLTFFVISGSKRLKNTAVQDQDNQVPVATWTYVTFRPVES